MQSAIFISYRRDDAAKAVDELQLQLSRRCPHVTVFRDTSSILPGEDFRSSIGQAIERCKLFVAVIGRDWLCQTDGSHAPRLFDPTDWVHRELDAALSSRIPVLPLIVDGASMPKASELPEPIRGLHAQQALAFDGDWSPVLRRFGMLAEFKVPERPSRLKLDELDRVLSDYRSFSESDLLASNIRPFLEWFSRAETVLINLTDGTDVLHDLHRIRLHLEELVSETDEDCRALTVTEIELILESLRENVAPSDEITVPDKPDVKLIAYDFQGVEADRFHLARRWRYEASGADLFRSAELEETASGALTGTIRLGKPRFFGLIPARSKRLDGTVQRLYWRPDPPSPEGTQAIGSFPLRIVGLKIEGRLDRHEVFQDYIPIDKPAGAGYEGTDPETRCHYFLESANAVGQEA